MEKRIRLHSDKSADSVHQYLYLYPFFRLMPDDRQQIFGALSVPHIKGAEYDTGFRPVYQPYAVFQGAFTCFQKHGPVRSRLAAAEAVRTELFRGLTAHILILYKRAYGPRYQIYDNAYHNYQYHPFCFYSHCLHSCSPLTLIHLSKSVCRYSLTASAACVHILLILTGIPSCTTRGSIYLSFDGTLTQYIPSTGLPPFHLEAAYQAPAPLWYTDPIPIISPIPRLFLINLPDTACRTDPHPR